MSIGSPASGGVSVPPTDGNDRQAAESDRPEPTLVQPLVGVPIVMDPAKQLDYAKDAILQVITLSSAIVAVSLTFAQNWASGASRSNKFLLQLSWCAFFLAILFGIWSILALTGLAYIAKPSVRRSSLRLPWVLQLISFCVGIGFLGGFGFRVL